MVATSSRGFVSAPKKGKSNNADYAKALASRAGQNIIKLMETHYAMVRDFSAINDDGESNITTENHIHYHVYGDYRLMPSELIGPHFDAGYTGTDIVSLESATNGELVELLDIISSDYNTSPAVITRITRAGGANQFVPTSMMRFKTTDYTKDFREADLTAEGFLSQPRLFQHLSREGYSSRENLNPVPNWDDENNGCDKLNGFVNTQEQMGDFIRMSRKLPGLEARASRWSNNQLHSGTQATRFFLPSLGTILVSGSRIDGLKKYVAERLSFIEDQVTEALDDNKYNAVPEFHFVEYDEFIDNYGALLTANQERSIGNLDENIFCFFMEWAKSIISHPDYRAFLEVTLPQDLEARDIALIAAVGGTPAEYRYSGAQRDSRLINPIRPTKIIDEAVKATVNSEYRGIFQAAETFMNELMNTGRAELVAGTAVKLTSGGGLGQDVLNRSLGYLDPDDPDDEAILDEVDEDSTFYINEIRGNRYQLSIVVDGDTILFPRRADNGRADNREANWFARNHFEIFDEDKGENIDSETLSEEGFKGQVDPLHRIFMRIVMDCYMTFETYAAITTGNAQFKKSNKYVEPSQDPQMDRPWGRGGGGGGGGGGKKKKKGSPGFAEFVAELRAELALGQLATSYVSMRGDSSKVVDFYDQDLVGAEILWLSNSISDFNPNLVSSTPSNMRNILVQQAFIPPQNRTESYSTITREEIPYGLSEIRATEVRDPGGAVGARAMTLVRNLQRTRTIEQETELPPSFEPVKPTTIFLRLDSALLRDIFIEYVRQHNLWQTEVARRAVRKSKGKRDKNKNQNNNKKATSILPTMWTLTKQMSQEVLTLDGTKPHIVWNKLFDAVDNYRNNLNGQYPMIPEHWAQTFTVPNLRKDPELTGSTPNIEEQIALLTEYMQFLEGTYYESFSIIAELVTALDMARIEMISDLDILKRYFVERIHEDTKSMFLDRMFWNGYQKLIYIMRTFADIPPELRGEYTASRFDAEAVEQMQRQARQTGTQGGDYVYGAIEDQSPRQMREGQVARRPGF